MNHKQDSELSFLFSFNDLFYTLNATRYTLEMNCPEVFVDFRQIDNKSQGSAFDNYCLSGKLN